MIQEQNLRTNMTSTFFNWNEGRCVVARTAETGKLNVKGSEDVADAPSNERLEFASWVVDERTVGQNSDFAHLCVPQSPTCSYPRPHRACAAA